MKIRKNDILVTEKHRGVEFSVVVDYDEYNKTLTCMTTSLTPESIWTTTRMSGQIYAEPALVATHDLETVQLQAYKFTQYSKLKNGVRIIYMTR